MSAGRSAIRRHSRNTILLTHAQSVRPGVALAIMDALSSPPSIRALYELVCQNRESLETGEAGSGKTGIGRILISAARMGQKETLLLDARRVEHR
jgi:hypothetical protein